MLHNMLDGMLDEMLDGMLASFDQSFYINFSFAERFPSFIRTYVHHLFSCIKSLFYIDFERSMVRTVLCYNMEL